MENLRECDVAARGRHFLRIDELLKKFPTITLYAEKIVDRVWIKFARVDIRPIPRLRRQPGPVVGTPDRHVARMSTIFFAPCPTGDPLDGLVGGWNAGCDRRAGAEEQDRLRTVHQKGAQPAGGRHAQVGRSRSSTPQACQWLIHPAPQ